MGADGQSDEAKIIAAIRKLGVGADHVMTARTNLRDDLGLDSAALIELTVVVHTMYAVDLGRRAAEQQAVPLTIGDLSQLMVKR
jgi:acyl carrier protein